MRTSGALVATSVSTLCVSALSLTLQVIGVSFIAANWSRVAVVWLGLEGALDVISDLGSALGTFKTISGEITSALVRLDRIEIALAAMANCTMKTFP
jgi:hypothetical protein